jgi:hypothetical protein
MMLGLVFVLAAAAASAAPADGAYNYAVFVGGAPAGKTTINLAHTPGGVQLTESATANYGGADFAGSATLNLDANLIPASYTAVYSPPGRTVHAAIAFNGKTANETADDGATAFTLEGNAKNFAVLDGTLFAGFFILPAQVRAWNAQSVMAVSPMFGHGGAIAFDAALKADRPKDVPAADVPISVSDPIQFTLWYDPVTLVVDELVVPQQDATYARLRAS